MSDFDVLAIGGGTAGMTVAKLCREAGARVCLVDRERLGGDCLYTGCVPSKTYIASARVFHEVKRASTFGVDVSDACLNLAAVRERARAVIATIGQGEAPQIFEDLGIRVKFGEARFLSLHELQVGDERLTAGKFVIATGSRPAVPSISGLAEAEPLTNETVFELERLPESLAIVGGGPIGCELAQVFARFGSRVSLIGRSPGILRRDDPELTRALGGILEREGVDLMLDSSPVDVRRSDGSVHLSVHTPQGMREVQAEEVLVAAGRAPNVEALDLAKARVRFDHTGVATNAYLRTSAPNVWACGDVTGKYQFTHVAYEQASVVARNIRGKKTRWSDRVVPWTTFTDPELARVGLTEEEARQKYGDKLRVLRLPFDKIDRALCESESEGVIKLLIAPGWMRGKFGGEIVGAHILGRSAGELLPEILLAMRSRLPAGLVAWPIHVYPTLGIGVRQALGQLFGAAA